MRFRPSVILVALWVLSCTEPSRAAPEAPASPKAAPVAAPSPAPRVPQPSRYDTPLRSEDEMEAALTATCEQAAEQKRPWLLELSASWCGDCRALHQLKQLSPLREELETFPSVVVNVGDFDRHKPLRKRLGVRSIAHWAVMQPTHCDQAAAQSPMVAQRTLEPRSGQPVSPVSLKEWLGEARHLAQSQN